jgi:hypothetical protein
VPILPADDAFKAVVAPPGSHRVRFVYKPWRVYAGMGISTLTLVAVLLTLRPRRTPLFTVRRAIGDGVPYDIRTIACRFEPLRGQSPRLCEGAE